jgi:hydroxymethylpyrimidine pyrophosphatase-like HAD family hydrolase
MRLITIAFDIDGTLRDGSYEKGIKANENIRTLLIILRKFKNVRIVVWSGSGKLYAQQIGHMFGLDEYVHRYASKLEYEDIKPDIAIDDIQDTNLGQINLIVREK